MQSSFHGSNASITHRLRIIQATIPHDWRDQIPIALEPRTSKMQNQLAPQPKCKAFGTHSKKNNAKAPNNEAAPKQNKTPKAK
ncbi:hypothetical protein [Denitrobacterium detoxificans]|uniref:hypothetical protein n=1 Tax=Denitrobacterium detoxificans TaxID=79604 RepID=UPI000941D60F|nr:hypothetical protein [Denitrobacterium detoxificans]